MLRRLIVPLVVMWAVPAAAQQAFTKDSVAAVVAETNRLIKTRYVFPEKADAVTGKLSQSLASGRYAVDDPAQLARLLTQDMQAVTRDKHMTVRYEPGEASSLMSATAAGPGPGNIAAQEYFANLMTSTNYGIPEMKVLPGNVRYINLAPAWLWDPQRSPKVFDDAMRFLKGGDAYIIDVRSNGGGNATGGRYIVSHFMDPDTKIMDYRLTGQAPTEARTQAVPEGRLDKPLYVLTSPGSASASEEFAAHIKNFKLGTLVGATTAGAGNRNMLFGTKEGFVVSVSIGTAIHPVTNQGWEGTGITPDIVVPVAQALDAAHLDALNKVKAKASGAKLTDIQWQIENLTAKVKPVALSQEALAAYAGSYGDQRKVVAEGGKLYWHNGPQSAEMLPLGEDLFGFAAGPNIRLKFDRQNGKVTAVTEMPKTGKPQSFPRRQS